MLYMFSAGKPIEEVLVACFNTELQSAIWAVIGFSYISVFHLVLSIYSTEPKFVKKS